MRGKREEAGLNAIARRITPACAGKTLPEPPLEHLCQDHPRVCGENRKGLKHVSKLVGSPPRVRGKRCFRSSICIEERITPACAGKTLQTSLPRSRRKDHPRVCGENVTAYALDLLETGSPPRVRGKPPNRAKTSSSPRITPACAGKTVEFTYRLHGRGDHPRVCGENNPALS